MTHYIIKIFYFIVLAIVLSGCKNTCNYIEDYYPSMYLGIIEYEKSNYKNAFKHLSKSFSSCSPRNTKTYYEIDVMAAICAKLGKNKCCQEMISIQLGNGFTLSKYQADSIYSTFFTSPLGIKLINQSDEIMKEYNLQIDTMVHRMLTEMLRDDQRARGSDEQFRLDSINEVKLRWIFDKNRFPKESLFRYKPFEYVDIHTMLLHTSDSIRINYFLPQIKKMIKNGSCDPKVYATLYDQYYLYNGMPQIYGTYKNSDREISEHIDIEQLEKNRISIGLPSLKSDAILHELKIINYPDTYGKFFN